MLVEMINHHRVAVVGGLGKIDLFSSLWLLFLTAARVEVDFTGSGLEVGDLYPDEALVHHRIELLDLRGEHGLVVAVDEAQVAAILLGVGEVEIPVMQTHYDSRGPDRIRNGNSIIRGIDGDLLASAPGLVPPGAGLETASRQDHQGD